MKVVVHTSYHQIVLAPMGVFAVADIDYFQQLVVLSEDRDAVVVGVGVRDGVVEVDVVTDPDEDWGPVEDEAAVVLDVTDDLWLTSPTVENGLGEVFSAISPGPHHVRVRARGRQDHPDLSVEGEEPVEWYQIAVWPVG